jgi:hypothetical protein
MHSLLLRNVYKNYYFSHQRMVLNQNYIISVNPSSCIYLFSCPKNNRLNNCSMKNHLSLDYCHSSGILFELPNIPSTPMVFLILRPPVNCIMGIHNIPLNWSNDSHMSRDRYFYLHLVLHSRLCMICM